MRRLTLFIALALATLVPGPVQAGGPPTVVELYTSQGCNSCPPADRFLGELAARDDVVALSEHITYWDYLGWKDTFGSRTATRRQRAYGREFGRNSVYTPQMVIGGREHVVGSDTAAFGRAMLRDQTDDRPRLDVTLTRGDSNTILAHIPAHESGTRKPAVVWLFRYDSANTVAIERGENVGKSLTYHNVVREIRELAQWRGDAMTIPLALDDLTAGGRDGCAVVVQRRGTGPIIGAARMELGGAS